MNKNSEKFKKHLPSLTIAIPAYNEEQTIGNILESIFAQKFNLCDLERVTVYCDGCSDQTADIAKMLGEKNSLLSYYDGKERIGKKAMLNRIFRENKSDYLLVLDADIGLDGSRFIQRLMSVVLDDAKNVMFAVHQIPVEPEGILEKCFYSSFLLWDYIRLRLPDKNHLENFYGAATVFKAAFIKDIVIPTEIADMRGFLYLAATKDGGFSYVDKASIAYWPPHTFSDFIKLIKRDYGTDINALKKIFGDRALYIYSMPRLYKKQGVIKFCKEHPFYAIPALFIGFVLPRITKIYQKRYVTARSLWEIAKSTKKIIKLKTSKKRIIFSNYDDLNNPWYGGGGALAVHEVAKRLSYNFELSVVTGKYPNCKNEVIDGVEYERIGIKWLGPKIGQLMYSLQLPFYLRRQKFDMWFESFTPPFTTGLLPLFTKRPVVGITHMMSGEDMYRKYKIPFYIFERLGCKVYRNFVVLSQVLKEEISSYNKKAEIEIIPNGIDLQGKISNPENRRYIIFIGRIEIDQKGLDLLLNATMKINPSLEYKLLIAGSGSRGEEKKLRKMLKIFNNKRVEFIGRVKGEEKDKFFKEAIFLVAPSRFDTFSLVTLEAFSYGLPVVVFDLKNFKWIPKECSIKIPTFDEDKFSKGMEKLIRDSKLRQEKGENAWNYVQDFSWDKIAKKYLNYIDNILISQKDE